MDTKSDLKQALQGKTRDDLHVIAKRLRIEGYRKLKKVDLISVILSARDESQLRKVLSVSWWDRYHNHVYGTVSVLGVLLTIVFFALQYFTVSVPSEDISSVENVADIATPARLAVSSVPEGYLPLTLEQLLAEVGNDDLTSLQRNSLKDGYVGSSVQWRGTVQGVSPLRANDPESDILLLISPVSSSDIFPPLISVLFSYAQRESLERLSLGYEVEFQADIRSFDVLSQLPRLDNGVVLGFVRND